MDNKLLYYMPYLKSQQQREMKLLKNQIYSCRWSRLFSRVEREMRVDLTSGMWQQINRPQNGVSEREAIDTSQIFIANRIICTQHH